MTILALVAAARDTGVIGRWAHLYSDNKYVSASVTFVHLAGVLVGGGLALAADRSSFRLAPAGPERNRQLNDMATIHRWVVGGLAFTFASGLLQFLADISTYLGSVVFWTKMGLIALLLANGYLRLRVERGLLAGRVGDAWFKRASVASAILWLGTLLAGTMLTTVS